MNPFRSRVRARSLRHTISLSICAVFITTTIGSSIGLAQGPAKPILIPNTKVTTAPAAKKPASITRQAASAKTAEPPSTTSTTLDQSSAPSWTPKSTTELLPTEKPSSCDTKIVVTPTSSTASTDSQCKTDMCTSTKQFVGSCEQKCLDETDATGYKNCQALKVKVNGSPMTCYDAMNMTSADCANDNYDTCKEAKKKIDGSECGPACQKLGKLCTGDASEPTYSNNEKSLSVTTSACPIKTNSQAKEIGEERDKYEERSKQAHEDLDKALKTQEDDVAKAQQDTAGLKGAMQQQQAELDMLQTNVNDAFQSLKNQHDAEANKLYSTITNIKNEQTRVSNSSVAKSKNDLLQAEVVISARCSTEAQQKMESYKAQVIQTGNAVIASSATSENFSSLLSSASLGSPTQRYDNYYNIAYAKCMERKDSNDQLALAQQKAIVDTTDINVQLIALNRQYRDLQVQLIQMTRDQATKLSSLQAKALQDAQKGAQSMEMKNTQLQQQEQANGQRIKRDQENADRLQSKVTAADKMFNNYDALNEIAQKHKGKETGSSKSTKDLDAFEKWDDAAATVRRACCDGAYPKYKNVTKAECQTAATGEDARKKYKPETSKAAK